MEGFTADETATCLLDLPPELVHVIAYEMRVLSGRDVVGLAMSCRALHAVLLGSSYSLNRARALMGPFVAASRMWWQAAYLALRDGIGVSSAEAKGGEALVKVLVRACAVEWAAAEPGGAPVPQAELDERDGWRSLVMRLVEVYGVNPTGNSCGALRNACRSRDAEVVRFLLAYEGMTVAPVSHEAVFNAIASCAVDVIRAVLEHPTQAAKPEKLLRAGLRAGRVDVMDAVLDAIAPQDMLEPARLVDIFVSCRGSDTNWVCATRVVGSPGVDLGCVFTQLSVQWPGLTDLIGAVMDVMALKCPDTLRLLEEAQAGYTMSVSEALAMMDPVDQPLLCNMFVMACTGGHCDTVEALFELATMPVTIALGGSWALVGAARFGHTDVVRFVLDNTDVAGAHIQTALELATLAGHVLVTEILFEFLSSANVAGTNMRNVFRAACSACNTEVSAHILYQLGYAGQSSLSNDSMLRNGFRSAARQADGDRIMMQILGALYVFGPEDVPEWLRVGEAARAAFTAQHARPMTLMLTHPALNPSFDVWDIKIIARAVRKMLNQPESAALFGDVFALLLDFAPQLGIPREDLDRYAAQDPDVLIKTRPSKARRIVKSKRRRGRKR